MKQNLFHKVKRLSFLLLAAVMIGVSNILYEEQRMVGDSATRIEIQQEESDDDPNAPLILKLEKTTTTS